MLQPLDLDEEEALCITMAASKMEESRPTGGP
jgi:hypothetical protein